MSLRTRGVAVLLAGVGAALLTACGSDAPDAGPVTVEAPTLTGAAYDACRSLLDDLPDTLMGQPSRPVDTPDGSVAAAWGDPAVVLRCGVAAPAVPDPTQECAAFINGVGWFGPDITQNPPAGKTTFQAVSREPVVELVVPQDYYEQSGSALAALAPALKAHLTKAQRCV